MTTHIAIYGPVGGGKTLAAALGAWALSGKVAAVGPHADAGAAITAVFGLPAPTFRRARFHDLPRLLAKVPAEATSVIVDDVSTLVYDEAARDGTDLRWKRIEHTMRSLFEAIEDLVARGTTVFSTWHEQDARMSSGRSVRGGPRAPGQLPEEVSSRARVVYRLVKEEQGPWRWAFYAGGDPDWISKDRYTPGEGSLHTTFLPEIMRRWGRDVRLPDGVTDEAISEVASLADDPARAVEYARSLGLPAPTGRFLLQAGWARARLAERWDGLAFSDETFAL